MIRTCYNGACEVMRAGAAKGLDMGSILSVSALKGDEQLTKALTPSLESTLASMKGVDAQKAVSCLLFTV